MKYATSADLGGALAARGAPLKWGMESAALYSEPAGYVH